MSAALTEWVMNGRVELRGPRWKILARRLGRVFGYYAVPGERIRLGYGLAWRDFSRRRMMMLVMPLNLFVRAFLWAYFWVMRTPFSQTLKEEREAARVNVEKLADLQRRLDEQEPELRMLRAFWDRAVVDSRDPRDFAAFVQSTKPETVQERP